ncbi:MAG: molybdopterin-dependent oxidoreductase, partial [Acetobacteraceae bacterium]|nr:molybdopterin-dependent oxidoreductase [Acetobacteraceae bacterium]
EVTGLGLHRIWWTGGRYAYASALLDGFTDHILIVIDMNEPSRPREVGRWWIPGMNAAAGETPEWSNRWALHHAVVADDIAYGSWRDGGLTILDVKDKATPKLIAHRNWCPPYGGGTHSALPLHDRGLLVVADEATMNIDQEQLKRTWVFDIREKSNPVSIATLPTPAEQEYIKLGGQFWTAQPAREPAWEFPVLDHHLCHLAKRWVARVRHLRSVPAEGDRVFRAAAAHALDGTTARAREDAPHRGPLRRAGWVDLPYGLRRGPLHCAMAGRLSAAYQRGGQLMYIEPSRREFLTHASAAMAGLALLQAPRAAEAIPARAGEEVVPWLDQPSAPPRAIPGLTRWEDLDSWTTPNDRFFSIAHYNRPVIEENAWKLSVSGLVRQPLSLTLTELKSQPKQEVVFTLECSGNNGRPYLISAIGNARWAGVPLASVLQQAGVQENAVEVVFFGADSGEEQIRDAKVREHFARSSSVADAMNPNNLLCYEMNGAPLPAANGFPLRLIVPGWYGVANVKWLTRIEVRDSRYMGRFMGRDYVTIREEMRDGQMVAIESSVARTRLKSAPARVARLDGQYRIMGFAWGASIAKVQVRIDDGPWGAAALDPNEQGEFAWRSWSLGWPDPAAGEHTITSRATDTAGNVQPAPDDAFIANKRTYWESNGQVSRKVRIG